MTAAATNAKPRLSTTAPSFEWLHRMCQEPSRMVRRYFINNLALVGLVLGQLCRTLVRPTILAARDADRPRS